MRWRVDPAICVHARAHAYGLLPAELRDETSSVLERALLSEADTSFLEEDAILDLIAPQKLLHLARRIRDKVLANFPDMASGIIDNADLDAEPASNFDDINAKLQALTEFFAEDETAESGLDEARGAIDSAVNAVAKKKEEKENEGEEEDDWDWKSLTPSAPTAEAKAQSVFDRPTMTRSLFSDVDE